MSVELFEVTNAWAANPAGSGLRCGRHEGPSPASPRARQIDDTDRCTADHSTFSVGALSQAFSFSVRMET